MPKCCNERAARQLSRIRLSLQCWRSSWRQTGPSERRAGRFGTIKAVIASADRHSRIRWELSRCASSASVNLPQIMVETALERFGRIDTLVNNAGIWRRWRQATAAIVCDRGRQIVGHLAPDGTAARVACDAPASTAVDAVRGPVAVSELGLIDILVSAASANSSSRHVASCSHSGWP